MAATDGVEKRKRGSSRQRVSCALAGLVIAFAAAAWFLTREPQLSDHAARVTNVTSYAWINDHELLWAMPNSAHLSRIDLRTHDQRLLDTVNASADTRKWSSLNLRSVAPDGHRALSSISRDSGEVESGLPQIPENRLVELEGKVPDAFETMESPVWMPDGRRWLALGPAERNRYDDTPTPPAIWLYSADAPNRKLGPLPAPKAVKALLGVTPDYRLIITDLPAGIDEPSVTIWQRGIYLNNAPERQVTLTAPSGWFYRAAALSPAGDRVAWLLTSAQVSPLLAFVHKVVPGLVKSVKATRTFQIRTSRIDGSDMREIGFQEEGKSSTGVVSDLKWNPDGKRLSFVFRGNLYIVPAGG